MWKPLSIVSGVALLAAGGIDYVMVRPTLIAERIQVTNAEGYRDRTAKLKVEAEEANKVAESELAKMKDSLSKAERAKAEAAAKKDEVAKTVEDATTSKATATKDLDDLEVKLKDLGGLDAMVAELKAQEAKRVEYDKQIASAKATIASALAGKAAKDKQIADIKRIDLWQQTGTMAPTFRSRINAVNPDWGFVTIAAGNGAGVTRQAKLDVVRGSSVVGKLIVTHVSPGSSAAEIVPGSVAPGDAILPGDSVKTGSASLPGNIPVAAAPTAASTAKPSAPAAPAKDAAPAVDPFAAPADAPAAPATPAADAPAADAPATPAADAPATPAADPAKPAEAPMNN